MELKISSLKPVHSLSDGDSDPEEKHISEEDDDDRNHKHRRKEDRSQSAEMDNYESVLTRPYRKWNKPFENGHLYRNSDPATSDKEHTPRFDKRRGMTSFSRAPQAANQRAMPSFRGRGRELGGWVQRDLRFMSAAPSFLAGRGMSNLHDAQSSSWATFGMFPGIRNAGLDILNPCGLHGTVRAPLNPSMGMGVPLQRCRDFEERGFCLRGDMCPMEHGVNRIVVEDVQSLSQFNLPISVPSAHMMGTVGQGVLPAVGPSGSFVNCKALHINPGRFDEELGLNGALMGNYPVGGADVYDPDQPLWTNDNPETSPAVIGANPPSVEETAPLVDMNSTDNCQVGPSDDNDIECRIRSSGSASQSQGALGRNDSSKSKAQVMENIDSTAAGPSRNLDVETKKTLDSSTGTQGAFHRGKQFHSENTEPPTTEPSSKSQSNIGHNMRKSSQKALRTLAVSGIPQLDNKMEALFAHFQKFGEIIDIYIPLNGDRAFVQFSKREEADAALKSPDAVMGNRFIKLWWAKRDRIPEKGVSSGYNAQRHAAGAIPASAPSHVSVAYKRKENIQSAAPISSVAAPPAPDHKHIITCGPKAPPASQKKQESLELLKEELRKKQEMLDQKRNAFRRQLDELEKQATAHKDGDPASKRQKKGAVSESLKAENSRSIEPDIAVSVPTSCSNSVPTVATPQPPISKPSIRPLEPLGAPLSFNRYKLDNRPTAFKINPPIPNSLANVDVLKEHFSAFGELLSVELEEAEQQDDSGTSKLSARVSFTSRLSADRAFLNGKSWQGHGLQFKWLSTSNSIKDGGAKNGALTGKDVGVEDEDSTPCLQSSDTGGGHPPAIDATGSVEIENIGQCENGEEGLNVDEVMSGKKQSP